MSKVWRVAKNEYLNIVRTKAFIISLVLMPVLMVGSIAVQTLLKDKVDLSNRRVAVVDGTGRLFGALAAAAEQRNKHQIFEGEDQKRPRFRPEASDEDQQALSDRVRSGDLFAYVVVGEGVVAGEGEIAYHTDTPTYRNLPRWVEATLNAEIRRLRFEEHDLNEELVRKLNAPARLTQYGLVEVTAAGEVKAAEKVDKLKTFAVPAAAMILLFMLVMMATPALLNNVLEEKMQRIVEVLVASVSPFELFMGKLLGTAFVSWTLSLLYLGGVLVVAAYSGFSDAIPVSLVCWFLFWQLCALLIFGSIFSGIGAACSEIRDAQAMMMPAMLVMMLPMFLWILVLQQPDSPFAIGASLFPPATPFLMLVRQAVPPGPAAWEIAVAVLLTAGFTSACVWGAGRIFRIGILAQGQAPSFRRLLGWLRRID